MEKQNANEGERGKEGGRERRGRERKTGEAQQQKNKVEGRRNDAKMFREIMCTGQIKEKGGGNNEKGGCEREGGSQW